MQAAALSIADTIRVEGGKIAVDLPYSSLSILAMARRDRIFYRIDAPGGGLVTGYGDLPVTLRDAGDSDTASRTRPTGTCRSASRSSTA